MKNNYTLRISVTSCCNLNCSYCNTKRAANYKEILSDKDIIEIIKAGFLSGVKKISWTGGEPTVRPGFVKLVKAAKKIGIESQSITTNGILYSKIAKDLYNNGITKVNFSLDTLNKKEYIKICGFDCFEKVILSINEASKYYDRVKVNCVVTQKNRKIIKEMVDYFDKFKGNVVVRFLEIVPCGEMYEKNKSIFNNNFLSVNEIISDLKKIGKITQVFINGDVPKSKYFKINNKNGIYGVNPNHSAGYKCDKKKCPKIRISPNGFVSNCTTNLEYVRDFREKTLKEKVELMKIIVEEKNTRNFKGFLHKQKYYDFWRFGINPEYIIRKFYKK